MMENLNLGQNVANKRERKQTTPHKDAKFYPLLLAVRMRRYGSLININPSGQEWEQMVGQMDVLLETDFEKLASKAMKKINECYILHYKRGVDVNKRTATTHFDILLYYFFIHVSLIRQKETWPHLLGTSDCAPVSKCIVTVLLLTNIAFYIKESCLCELAHLHSVFFYLCPISIITALLAPETTLCWVLIG